MSRASVGLTLQPDDEYLGLCDRLLREEAEHFEVAPETTWRPALPEEEGGARAGGWAPNGFHARFLALQRETEIPVLAHGVSLSPASAAPDPVLRRRLLERIAADHAQFDFAWYTDHFGATELDGRSFLLPLPPPLDDGTLRAVRTSLDAARAVVPDVGLENSAFPFVLGDPLEEPAFLARCVAAPRTHLLLDLHNLHANAMNVGFDPGAWLERAPLDAVIEVHLAGGRPSEPGWLPSGERLLLDSHDSAVPEEVWDLLDAALPRCPNLRAVTLERMEGTVAPADVPLLAAELARARRAVEGLGVR